MFMDPDVRPGRPGAEVLDRREGGKGRAERDIGESFLAAASRDEHGASSSERPGTVSSLQVPDQRVALHGLMQLLCVQFATFRAVRGNFPAVTYLEACA